MAKFVPCQGKTACREDETGCKTCGRSSEEIATLRSLLDQLATLAVTFDYDNPEEYAGYVHRKLVKTISYRNQARQEIESTHADES
ncbi:MAG: hypothetical protein P8101_06990 [Candidatus Thiodiazotropha sp.]|jgi:hypothetical protein